MTAVHITFLLDRSGSMNKIKNDVVGGFNGFLSDQQAQPGDCRLTMVQFDSQGFDHMHVATPIKDVKRMELSDFQPRGGTPLYDSIAKAIREAEAREKTKTANPEAQLLVIFTDGEENQSREFNGEEGRRRIFEMIESKQGQGWIITYLGANQDAYAVGASMGVMKGATQNFAPDSYGVAATYASVSKATSNMRSTYAGGQSLSPEEFYVTGKDAEDDFESRKESEK